MFGLAACTLELVGSFCIVVFWCVKSEGCFVGCLSVSLFRSRAVFGEEQHTTEVLFFVVKCIKLLCLVSVLTK